MHCALQIFRQYIRAASYEKFHGRLRCTNRPYDSYMFEVCRCCRYEWRSVFVRHRMKILRTITLR